ncbi:MAG: TIM barrel protein [Bacillota bacterium]|nr:TIM barrel protein [Bacillota bacterium]
MNEPMNHYMKVGLIHFMAYPQTMKGEGPIVETVRKIALDDYFSVIELTWIKDSKIRSEVRKILDTAHMTVAFGGQPMLLSTGMNINDLDEEKRQKAVALLKEGIDEAVELGAVGFAFLSGHYEEVTRKESLAALVKSTRELCYYAKQKSNLKIVHEVFDYDIDKKSLIGPAALARRYAETVRQTHDNFGLMVDLSHLPLLHETAEQAIVPIQDYLVHAHMGNCVVHDAALPAYGDVHPRFGFPGSENDVPELTEYLRILLQVGYLNTKNPPIVSFEVKPFADEDPDLVIANAKRVLNDAWARL